MTLNGRGKVIDAVRPNYIKGLFEIRLFCWNWKFFVESSVDKSKS